MSKSFFDILDRLSLGSEDCATLFILNKKYFSG